MKYLGLINLYISKLKLLTKLVNLSILYQQNFTQLNLDSLLLRLDQACSALLGLAYD